MITYPFSLLYFGHFGFNNGYLENVFLITNAGVAFTPDPVLSFNFVSIYIYIYGSMNLPVTRMNDAIIGGTVYFITTVAQ